MNTLLVQLFDFLLSLFYNRLKNVFFIIFKAFCGNLSLNFGVLGKYLFMKKLLRKCETFDIFVFIFDHVDELALALVDDIVVTY